MGRLCTVCVHPERKAIDLALMLHQEGYGAISRRFGLVKRSLQRHEENHLAFSWEHSKRLNAMLSAENLLAKLGELDAVTRDILEESRKGGDNRMALAAIRESRSNIVSFAQIGPMSELEQRLAALEEQKGATDG